MMNVEGFERRQLWPEVLFQHLPGRTEENHKKPQAGRESNQAPAKYKSEILPTELNSLLRPFSWNSGPEE